MNHICIDISIWDFAVGIALLSLVVILAARYVFAIRESNRRGKEDKDD